MLFWKKISLALKERDEGAWGPLEGGNVVGTPLTRLETNRVVFIINEALKRGENLLAWVQLVTRKGSWGIRGWWCPVVDLKSRTKGMQPKNAVCISSCWAGAAVWLQESCTLQRVHFPIMPFCKLSCVQGCACQVGAAGSHCGRDGFCASSSVHILGLEFRIAFQVGILCQHRRK